MSETPKICAQCPVGLAVGCQHSEIDGTLQRFRPGPECPFVRLDAKDELHSSQLAATMTASVQNTEESKKERIAPDHPYYTVAYADVCAAVDREIALRDRNALLEEAYNGCQIHNDHLRAEVARLDQSLATAADGLITEHDKHLATIAALSVRDGEVEEKNAEIERLRAEMRGAFAEYYRTEGCGCCSSEGHRDAENEMGILLGAVQYADGSGYDWEKTAALNEGGES